MLFKGQLDIQESPSWARPAQLQRDADSALMVSRAGLGNERWSVTLFMNKHDSPHLHEAGDCKISWSKL